MTLLRTAHTDRVAVPPKRSHTKRLHELEARRFLEIAKERPGYGDFKRKSNHALSSFDLVKSWTFAVKSIITRASDGYDSGGNSGNCLSRSKVSGITTPAILSLIGCPTIIHLLSSRVHTVEHL